MRVFELLEAAPHVGRKKIERVNLVAAAHRVNIMRPIGSLSARSREWLIAQLPPLQIPSSKFEPVWCPDPEMRLSERKPVCP